MTYRQPGHSHYVSEGCYPESCTGHEDWKTIRKHDPLEQREGNLGEVIDRRVQVYGDPTETFVRIAQMWSGLIGHHINPVEVPLMMAAMKMVRTQVMPDYSDNSDDIDGYLDIFRKIVGEDMIHARTVNEFVEKKWPAPEKTCPCGKVNCTENDHLFWPEPYDEAICRQQGYHSQAARHVRSECPVGEG